MVLRREVFLVGFLGLFVGLFCIFCSFVKGIFFLRVSYKSLSYVPCSGLFCSFSFAVLFFRSLFVLLVHSVGLFCRSLFLVGLFCESL